MLGIIASLTCTCMHTIITLNYITCLLYVDMELSLRLPPAVKNASACFPDWWPVSFLLVDIIELSLSTVDVSI